MPVSFARNRPPWKDDPGTRAGRQYISYGCAARQKGVAEMELRGIGRGWPANFVPVLLALAADAVAFGCSRKLDPRVREDDVNF
jgi:hypothetical protein